MESETIKKASALKVGDYFLRFGCECVVWKVTKKHIHYKRKNTYYFSRRKNILRIGINSQERILIINKNDQQ